MSFIDIFVSLALEIPKEPKTKSPIKEDDNCDILLGGNDRY